MNSRSRMLAVGITLAVAHLITSCDTLMYDPVRERQLREDREALQLAKVPCEDREKFGLKRCGDRYQANSPDEDFTAAPIGRFGTTGTNCGMPRCSDISGTDGSRSVSRPGADNSVSSAL